MFLIVVVVNSYVGVVLLLFGICLFRLLGCVRFCCCLFGVVSVAFDLWVACGRLVV